MVLAGGSRQCALCAASTSPDSASATIHDRAVRSLGSTGAPPASATCVPACPSLVPPTVDMPAGGATDGPAVDLAGLEPAGDADARADGEPDDAGDGDGLGAASETGAVSARDARVAEVTSRARLTV
ncbi:hypothetical protein GCM10010269_41700 [Streptomyces humidus]|uniref:Uncharacterized protein n=1 Tax=Streptomyces humidus TaxID=52259 RepID=A0A918L4X7_9ACTN|nr:hypothetical protein GCM10010269_41700 [Streptomyces humidus]